MNCRSTKPSNTEAGQASIVVVLMLSLFLLAALAFAVDYTNIWFQRQQAQTAADAACSAGAMDIYQLASGATLPNSGFVLGTGGSCSSYGSAGPTMCWYASKNGFNGYTGGAATVSWTFPSSVTGVTPPPTSVTQYPFMQVSVSLPVKTYFSTLVDRQPDATSVGQQHLRAYSDYAGRAHHGAQSQRFRLAVLHRRRLVDHRGRPAAQHCGELQQRDRGFLWIQRRNRYPARRPESYRLRCRHLWRPNYRARFGQRLLWNQRQHRIAGRLQRRHHRPLGVAGQPGCRSLLRRAGCGRHEECHAAYSFQQRKLHSRRRTTPMVVRIPTLPTTMVGDRRTIPSKGARNTPRDTIPAGSRKTGMTSLPSCPAPTIWMATWPSAAAIAYAWPSRAPIPWA